MKRKQKPDCRTCRWRKEKRLAGHHYLHDRVVHICTQPSQVTVLGVDWLIPNSPRLAELGHCDYYQPGRYRPVPKPVPADSAAAGGDSQPGPAGGER